MSAIYDDLTIIPLATYTGAGPIDSPPQRAHGANGAIFTLYYKTAVTATLALRVVLITHADLESQEAVLNVSKTQTGASRVVWMWYPGAAAQPDGETGITTVTTVVLQNVSLPLPDKFIVRIEKGDSTDAVFGVSMRRLP